MSRMANSSGTDADKLKALDQEYHYLIETNQNVKAEQIQALYQFKAKQMSTVRLKFKYIFQNYLRD